LVGEDEGRRGNSGGIFSRNGRAGGGAGGAGHGGLWRRRLGAEMRKKSGDVEGCFLQVKKSRGIFRK
jgi:hypothetical protein